MKLGPEVRFAHRSKYLCLKETDLSPKLPVLYHSGLPSLWQGERGRVKQAQGRRHCAHINSRKENYFQKRVLLFNP